MILVQGVLNITVHKKKIRSRRGFGTGEACQLPPRSLPARRLLRPPRHLSPQLLGKADNWDLFCQIGLRNNWNTLNATCARAVAVECGRRWTQNGIGHGGIRLRRQTLVDGSITPQRGSPCHAVCWASVPEEKLPFICFPSLPQQLACQFIKHLNRDVLILTTFQQTLSSSL